jgi:hypothetical protein
VAPHFHRTPRFEAKKPSKNNGSKSRRRSSLFKSGQARSHRTAVATPIPKRSAAAWRDRPPSTAAITRTRKSSDKVFAIAPGPRPADRVNQITPASGKHFRESVREDRV